MSLNEVCRTFLNKSLTLLITGLLIVPVANAQLTIFQNINQAGTQADCVAGAFLKGSAIPQDLENKISSISLQQGYMATLAENEDGTGNNYTFVAAVSDIQVDLSSNLNDKVSFIRMLPLRNTLKKGVGNTNNNWISPLNVSWFYDWGTGDATTALREYAMMAWGRGAANNPANIDAYIAKDDVTHLLSFNEPDNTDQSNISSTEAVTLHQKLAATGYRLGSPATTEGEATKWLSDFMTKANTDNVKVDFIAVHWYDWGSYLSTKSTSPDPQLVFNRFKNYVNNIYAIYKKPIWITEFNANKNTTSATHEAFIQLALPWLEAQDFVERYAYFFPPALPPVDGNGDVTLIGIAYRDFVSTPAIKSNIDNKEKIAEDNAGTGTSGISTFYEAEDAALTGATKTNCVRASGGVMVSAVTGTNKVLFSNITATEADDYTLDVAYFAASARSITVKINNGAPQVVPIAASGSWCYQGGSPGSFKITVALQQGANTIEFTDAPILDMIGVAKAGGSLPVSLLSFTGQAKDNAIHLSWQTTQEVNNDYFEILRSSDTRNFIVLTSIKGAGTSSLPQSYSYGDYDPLSGLNYYQLKQFDKDGRSTSFKTIAVDFTTLQRPQMKLVSVSANEIHLNVFADKIDKGFLTVAMVDGKVLYRSNVTLQSGTNQLKLHLKGQSQGVRIITLRSATGLKSIKVLQ